MHNFSYIIEDSLGQTNTAFVTDVVTNGNRYPWLTWNNRPYVSQYELANVNLVHIGKFILASPVV